MRTIVLLSVSLLLLTAEARADRCGPQVCGVCPAPCVACGPCGSATSCCPQVTCAPASVPKCGPQYRDVETVVYESQLATEKRTVSTIECKPEERIRQVSVYRTVEERRQVPFAVTVMVPEVRRQIQTWTECRQVWEDKVQNFTVMVPHAERRQGLRTVCKPVTARATRFVCEDQGHWEERIIPTAIRLAPQCHPCGSPCPTNCCPIPCPPRTCRVWVPQIVQRAVEYTYCKIEYSQEPYEYNVTVCKPEPRQSTVRVCRQVTEQKSKEVEFTVCVPKIEQRTREVVEYRCVSEQKEERFTVMVPHEVKREVDVQVCRLVPRRVVQRVPVCNPCCQTPCNACGN